LKQDYDSNTDNNQKNQYYGLKVNPSDFLDFLFHLFKLTIFQVFKAFFVFFSVSCLKLDGLRSQTLAGRCISRNNEVMGSTAPVYLKGLEIK
jgi:hypothetical protein